MGTFNIITATLFISSIALEAFLNARDNLDHYEKKDSIVNITIAIIGVTVNLLVKGMMLSFYFWTGQFAFFSIGTGLLAWTALFFLTDLQYYLFHVLGHKSRFFWAMHVVHHSSHKFNFTTAIRTPFTNCVFRFACLTPFVLMGFNPLMVIWMDSLVVSFTFFQHTEMVKKLGWLEYIFSTPSHHRVHHACDEKYIDKNFGGILILWDKLFGTFQKEEERPTFGLTKPLKDRGVLNVLFYEWKDIFRDLFKASGWNERIHYLFARPGWKPAPSEAGRIFRLSFPPASIARGLFIVILLLGMISTLVLAQSPDEWIQKGIEAEKKFNDQAAYEFYEQAIKSNPKNPEALWRASRVLSNLAGRLADKSEKAKRARQAAALARQATQLVPISKEAHICYIIALGLLSETASSPSEKLVNAKIIYAEAETILKLDSLYAPVYYVMGKWHLELSKLNWAERLACNLLFGGVPRGVSFEKSLRYFDKAIQLQPDYILFHYGKATALYCLGKYDKVIAVLENALQLSPAGPDDKIRQKKCHTLLMESKQLNAKA